MKPGPACLAVALAVAAGAFLLLRPGFAPPGRELPGAVGAVSDDLPDAAPAGESRLSLDYARADAVAPAGCELTIHYLPKGDGTTVELQTCEPIAPREPHPYASYSSEALETLAYSDARAAEYLGMRLRERNEAAAMGFIIRASALAGGDATPLVNFTRAYLRPDAIDDEPVNRTVRVKYVLSAVTQLLGDGRHVLPHYEAIIREYSTDPDREIAMLDDRARHIVDEMRRIQIEVRGAATIGG